MCMGLDPDLDPHYIACGSFALSIRRVTSGLGCPAVRSAGGRRDPSDVIMPRYE